MGMVLLTLFSVVWYSVMRRIAGRAASQGTARGLSLAPLRERIVLYRKWLVLGGFFLAIAGFLPMIANRIAPIAYIGTLKRLAIPIGVFASARWFHERVPPGRWITTAIITTGAMILVLDGTHAKVVDLIDQLFSHSVVP